MSYGILSSTCLKPGIHLLTLGMLWLSTSTVDAARFVLSDGTSVHMNLSAVGKYFQALGSMVGRVEDTGEAISLTGVSMVQLRMLEDYMQGRLSLSDVGTDGLVHMLKAADYLGAGLAEEELTEYLARTFMAYLRYEHKSYRKVFNYLAIRSSARAGVHLPDHCIAAITARMAMIYFQEKCILLLSATQECNEREVWGCLSKEWFSNSPRLLSLPNLYLDDNNIEYVSHRAFIGFTHLIKLSLSGNVIQEIAAGAFRDLSSLIELFLDGNEIRSLSAGVFDGMSSLRTLTLHNNHIQVIQKGVFNCCPFLCYLHLDYNHIQSIEEGAFDGMPFLSYIGLSGNPISRPLYGIPLPLFVELRRFWHIVLCAASATIRNPELGAPSDPSPPSWRAIRLLWGLPNGAVDIRF
ncbi:hypothetical protein PBRA_000277 [Plasmodiophora brassicae]|uniref:Uncharacterized protein n=1 Tax=Plasmodiophora brassicae TaxID=37360 RepID=A0A0G4IHA5_PLABS|nr:hypothetical protein PBRA_000277 [Plasmodiophora brassicae]